MTSCQLPVSNSRNWAPNSSSSVKGTWAVSEWISTKYTEKLHSGGPTTSRVSPEVVPVAAVVGAFVSADGMKKLVFGPATVFPFVGKENCSATHSEEAVGDKHGTLVAIIPVQGDIFRAHNYRVGAPAHLHAIVESLHLDFHSVPGRQNQIKKMKPQKKYKNHEIKTFYVLAYQLRALFTERIRELSRGLVHIVPRIWRAWTSHSVLTKIIAGIFYWW